MKTSARLFLILSFLLSLAGCKPALECGDIALSADKDGRLQIASAAASTPLIGEAATLSTLRADGAEVAFGAPEVFSRLVSDVFGKNPQKIHKQHLPF